MRVYLDIARGDAAAHSKLVDQHHHVVSWLSAQHASYGLPTTIAELDEIQRETLQSLFEDNNPGKTCLIDAPDSLVIGRLEFELSDQPNLSKHVENFRLLCTGESFTFQGKELNKKNLSYVGTLIHRWVERFVIQGGDVTRGDGTGGESVYGSPLPDPKPPHSTHSYGTLSMASGSSKNSSTSQFFICLCGPNAMDPSSSKDAKASLDAAKKKLDGKYFPFGRLVEGQHVLRRLEEEVQADGAERPVPKVWVDAAGVVPDE